MRRFFQLLCLVFFASFPENAVSQGVADSEKIYLRNIEGIVLLGSKEAKLSSDFQGVIAVNLTLPGPLKKLESRLLPLFYQQDLNEEKIQKIKYEIACFYTEYHRPFVQIKIPKQKRGNNYFYFLIEEAKVGSIQVAGNEYFSDQSILQFLRLKCGDFIDTKRMLADLNLINRNPFRRVDVVYAAGSEPRTTDITLTVRDRIPIRSYVGFDNTGADPLGRERIYVGMNWANAFNLGHVLSLQYTTNPYHPSRFQSLTGHYTAPLSWRHVLVVYGGYSWISSPPVPSLKTKGKTAQTSLRYQIPLPSDYGLLHELEYGADWKWTNNELAFNAGGVINRYTNLFQFELGYNLDYQTQNTNTTFDIELYLGPGKWLPHESIEDYSLLRFGSKPSYFYTRLTLSEVFQLPRQVSIWCFLRGQFASGNLLPSEQVGLGGFDTVRGYDERVFNVDNSLISNLELRSPVFRFFDSNPRNKWRTELTFLGFLDYGFGANHRGGVSVFDGIESTVWLSGIGPGVRLNVGRYFSVRYDWGVRLNKSHKAVGSGWQHSHFALVGSY